MTVWPFRPQMDVIEVLEWAVDVTKCRAAEYRHCMRTVPRMNYVCRYILDDDEYGQAREIARIVGSGDIYIPDWPNAVQIASINAGTVSLPVDTETVPAYVVNGYALIWESNTDYEAVQIGTVGAHTLTVHATDYAHTTPWVVPLRLAKFSQELSGVRGPRLCTIVSAVFLVEEGDDLLSEAGDMGFPDYNNSPVVTSAVELIGEVQERNLREVQAFDTRTAGVYRYNLYATPNQSAVLGWTLSDASEIWDMRLWLHATCGRWKQFWVPSNNADITITETIGFGATTIHIAAMGFADIYSLPVRLRILIDDVTMCAVNVTSVADGDPGEELLTIDSVYTLIGGTPVYADQFMATFELSTIHGAQKLTLSRFDADRIEIQHREGRQATVVVPIKEVPEYP